MAETMIEAGARALKEALGVALGAKPLQPDRRIPVRSDDWYTDPGTSGSVDLEDLMRAALLAMSSAPLDERVVEEVARAMCLSGGGDPDRLMNGWVKSRAQKQFDTETYDEEKGRFVYEHAFWREWQGEARAAIVTFLRVMGET